MSGLGADGYPTEEFLRRVREWDCSEPGSLRALFAELREAWHFGEWGWSEEKVTDLGPLENRSGYRFRVSTGGWSGNEDMISALEDNAVAWMLSWVQSRVGGHFVFEVEEDDEAE